MREFVILFMKTHEIKIRGIPKFVDNEKSEIVK